MDELQNSVKKVSLQIDFVFMFHQVLFENECQNQFLHASYLRFKMVGSKLMLPVRILYCLQ